MSRVSMEKKQSNINKIDPKVKDILALLGVGTFLAASLVFPGLPVLAKAVIDVRNEAEREKRMKEWDKYNLWRLRQVIKRMQDSKYVEIFDDNGISVVRISEEGKKKLFKYNLEDISLDESGWDGKWRLIIYDVALAKKSQSEMFRRTLNKLKLLKLQKSVYLTPFKCEDQIEYLRQMYDIGQETIILKVGSIENEAVYRKYFGI